VPPGEYNLDVYINDEFIASESVSFTQQNEDRDASSPCISVAQLKAWSIKTKITPSSRLRVPAVPDYPQSRMGNYGITFTTAH
jgi:outer membrane usher protein FimD/PapC